MPRTSPTEPLLKRAQVVRRGARREDAAVAIPHADRERVQVESRTEWRHWLAANSAGSPGVWAVTWRKASGRPMVGYEDLVEEALCFGWIDSTGRALDDDRTMLHFTPRKPGSGWSRPNKQRIERLMAAGAMAEAGLRVVAQAQRDGSWSKLDDVENLVVPDDLAAAFGTHPGSREKWDAFPRSARRAMLEWIVQAKRAPTRAARIEETARRAARGERANQPPKG
jgi:uncharacterized protein YdeI (YjbR/CyaY-like superfamily)